MCVKRPSNQVAELTAIIKSCQIAIKEGLERIVIVTDSKYASDAINKWVDLWKLNGWKDNRGKPIVNEVLLDELARMKARLNIKCFHVRGHSVDANNQKVDAMAREELTSKTVSCLTIATMPQFDQIQDPEAREIITHLQNNPNSESDYTLVDGLLYFQDPRVPVSARNRLFVPKTSRALMLKIAHDDPLYGGHLGRKKTRSKLENYYWPKMNSDIERHIETCNVCQQFKSSRAKRYGLLKPIAVSAVFERLHLDIVGPLKPSETGNRYIITAIDAFSRYAAARAYPAVRTKQIVEFLEEEIVSRHSLPEHIVTDNGTQFTSAEFAKFIEDLGIKHTRTCDYHPEANGMDERFNGSLIKVVRNYINADQRNWDRELKWALLIYNTVRNESTGLSPYTVLFGKDPRTPLTSSPGELDRIVDSEYANHDDIRTRALENMRRAQDAQKEYHDRDRREHNFALFDQVYVRLHAPPNRDDSRKLAPRWSGPCFIIKLLEHNGEVQAVEVMDPVKLKSKRVAFQDIKHVEQRLEDGLYDDETSRGLPGEGIRRAIELADHCDAELSTTQIQDATPVPQDAIGCGSVSPHGVECEPTSDSECRAPIAHEVISDIEMSEDWDPVLQGTTQLAQHRIQGIMPHGSEHLTPRSDGSLSLTQRTESPTLDINDRLRRLADEHTVPQCTDVGTYQLGETPTLPRKYPIEKSPSANHSPSSVISQSPRHPLSSTVRANLSPPPEPCERSGRPRRVLKAPNRFSPTCYK